MLPRCIRQKRMAANELAFGVELEQLVGHVTHRAFGFCFGFLPADAAEPIKRRRGRFARRISRHQIHPLDGHEKFGVIGINQQHELAVRALRRDRLQTIETPDAVINVNNIIAGFEIAKIRNECAQPCFASAGRRFTAGRRHHRTDRFAKNVRFGVNRQAKRRQFKSTGKIADDNRAGR